MAPSPDGQFSAKDRCGFGQEQGYFVMARWYSRVESGTKITRMMSTHASV